MINLSDLLQVDKKLRTFGVNAQDVSEQIILLLTALMKKEKSNQKHRDLLIALVQEKQLEISSKVDSLDKEISEIRAQQDKEPDNEAVKEKRIKKLNELSEVELKRASVGEVLKEMRSMIEADDVIGDDVESVLKSLRKYNKSFSEDFISALDIIRKMKGDNHE